MRRAAAALALLVACGGKSDDPPPAGSGSPGSGSVVRVPDKIQGRLFLNNAEQQLVSCVPGQTNAPHSFVVVITRNGALRFENQKLYWSLDTTGKTYGAELQCEKLDRSWGGGMHKHAPNTYYWRGTLSFQCRGPSGEVAGDLDLDCGGITDAERANLDKQREDLRRQQGSAVP